MTIHEIRLHVVVAADDDGGNNATVTAAQLEQRVEAANLIYAPTGIAFTFDPDTDLTQVCSTALNRSLTVLDPPDVGDDGWSQEPNADSNSHHRARVGLSQVFPGKLLVFCRRLQKLALVDSGTALPPKWQVVNAANSSSWRNWYINLSSSGAGLTTLAHEMGHYLQIRHTFSGADTVAAAAAAIKKAVENGSLKIQNGLAALDADRSHVTDTAADCDPDIYASSGVLACGAAGVPIPVDLGASGVKNYELKPDKLNVMSYHSCPGTKTVSAQQSQRVRDGLEIGFRQRLVGFPATGKETLAKKGSSSAGQFSALDVAAIRYGRLVIALRNAEHKLQLIAWDVSEDGVFTRRGDAFSGGEVKPQVRACALGLGLVVTAVRTPADDLKVIVWSVGDGGEITRKGDAVVISPGLDFAICRVGIEQFAVASRGGSSDTLSVDVWNVDAMGQIVKVASSKGDLVITGDEKIAAFPVVDGLTTW